MFNVNCYKRNTNNHLIVMLNPMFYQLLKLFITEWEMLVKKTNKMDVFANKIINMILIGHVPWTLGNNIICPIEGFHCNQLKSANGMGKRYMNVLSSLDVLLKMLVKSDWARYKGFVLITHVTHPTKVTP